MEEPTSAGAARPDDRRRVSGTDPATWTRGWREALLSAQPNASAFQGCRVLVSTVGTTPITSAQAIVVTRPAKVFLIASEGTRAQAEAISSWCKQIERRPEVEIVCCDALGTRDLLHRIRDAIARSGEAPEKVLIDMTGGRKSMSAVALLAGYQLGVPVIYSEFDEGANGATLRSLEGLRDVYDDEEVARAASLFELRHFDAAAALLESVYARVSHGRDRVQAALDLAKFYAAWVSLGAVDDGLLQRVGKAGVAAKVLGREDLARFDQHLRIAWRVGGRNATPWAFALTLLVAAKAHFDAGRYDFAALLAYRTVEHACVSAIQERLGVAAESVNWESARWSNAGCSQSEFERKYLDLSRQLNPGSKFDCLPKNILRLNGMLIASLAFPEWRVTEEELRTADGILEARNKSYIVHGTSLVDRAKAEQFLALAERWADRLDWRSDMPDAGDLLAACTLPRSILGASFTAS